LDIDSTCDLNSIVEVLTAEDSNNITYRLQFKRIWELQQKDKELLDQAATSPHFHLKSFSGGSK